MTATLNGVAIIDKPLGPTSFAIVRQARALTGVRKIGHGGTLDPAASGVLPICFGEATKIAQFLLDADKQYDAVVSFGAATDTYDATGTVTERQPAAHLTATDVERALASFRGWITQRPPAYSALKRDGRPLYELARAGEVVEATPRQVRIDRLELTSFHPTPEGQPRAGLTVACSKGTYIRSLAHDLGAALAVGAHLQALRRTRSGPFRIEDAIPPERLSDSAFALISPADALRGLPSLTLSATQALALTRGQILLWRDVAGSPPAGEGPVSLLDEAGGLVAVAPRGEPGDRIRTQRVFHAEDRTGRTERTGRPEGPSAAENVTHLANQYPTNVGIV
jgi:tRNA pseudouridine55 synthase